jgi:hypothetical protein
MGLAGGRARVVPCLIPLPEEILHSELQLFDYCNFIAIKIFSRTHKCI